MIQKVPSTDPCRQTARSERPSTLVTIMTLGGRGGSLQLDGLEPEAVDEDEVEAGLVVVGSREAAEAAVKAGVEAGLRNVPAEAVYEADVSREVGPAAEADDEAEVSREAGPAGADVSREVGPAAEAVDEATVSCEAGPAGAVNTSSSKSACESGGGSSNRVFMLIFLQSLGKSSSMLLSKTIILSPPIL